MRKDKRKLLLSKETIASLEKGELIKVAGGGSVGGTNLATGCNTFCSCPNTR